MGKKNKNKTKTIKTKDDKADATIPPTNSNIQNAIGIGIIATLLGAVFLFFLSGPSYIGDIQIDTHHTVQDLITSIQRTSLDTDKSQKVILNSAMFIGRTPENKRGMYAKAAIKKGDTIISLPISTSIQSHEIYPHGVWEPTLLKARRLKGYDKPKDTPTMIRLVTGLLGCHYNQVTGNKVKLAAKYYAANKNDFKDNSYQFWKKYHRQYYNSLKQYQTTHAPPSGVSSWPMFNNYYRTMFPNFPTDAAKKLYTMLTSNVFEVKSALVILPVVDFSNPSGTPNAYVNCTESSCEMVATSDIALGAEITRNFEARSNLHLLQKYGYHAGSSNTIKTGNILKDGCTISFESMSKYPETGGLSDVDFECLTSKSTVSATYTWLKEERRKYQANILLTVPKHSDLLSNKKDSISMALVQELQNERDVFKNDNPDVFVKLIAKEVSKEAAATDKANWADKANAAFRL